MVKATRWLCIASVVEIHGRTQETRDDSNCPDYIPTELRRSR